MVVSIKDFGLEKAEVLIKDGKDAETRVKTCRADVDRANARVAAAKKQVAAASAPNGNTRAAGGREKTLAKLQLEEKHLRECERALSAARKTAEQIEQKKNEQIHKLEQFSDVSRSNLKKLGALVYQPYSGNVAGMAAGMAERLNEAEKAREALLRSMGVKAKARLVSPPDLRGGGPDWNVGFGPMGLDAISGEETYLATGDGAYPGNRAPFSLGMTRTEGLREIEKRMALYRSTIIGLGIPDGADLDAFMQVLQEHYTGELDRKLNGEPNLFDEVPNYDTIQKLGIPFLMQMHSRIKNTKHPEVGRLYENFLTRCTITDANHTERGAYYVPGEGVHFNKTNDAKGNSFHSPYEVVFHELGHNIDFLLGHGGHYSGSYNNNELYEAMRRDYLAMKGSLSEEQLVMKILAETEKNGWSLREVASLSDALEGMTATVGNKGIPFPLGVGHGVDYWKRVPPNVEFFAEVLAGAMTNEKAHEVMKHYFPTAVAVVHKMIGGCI